MSNNDSQYKKNEIKFPTNNNTVPKFIFVIDKTLSTKGKIDPNIENFISSIKEEIRKTPSSCTPTDKNKQFIDMLGNTPSDLLLVGSVQQLHNLYGDSIDYDVITYYGKEKNVKNDRGIFEVINLQNNTFCSFLQSYTQKQKPDSPNRNTNFNSIISELDNETYINKSKSTVITIISDFFHEEETDAFYKLDKSLYDLSKRNISHLNMVKLYGSEKNKEDAIEKTINLFEKYFKHILNIFIYINTNSVQLSMKNRQIFPAICPLLCKSPNKQTLQK